MEQPVDANLVGSSRTCRGRCPQAAYDRWPGSGWCCHWDWWEASISGWSERRSWRRRWGPEAQRALRKEGGRQWVNIQDRIGIVRPEATFRLTLVLCGKTQPLIHLNGASPATQRGCQCRGLRQKKSWTWLNFCWQGAAVAVIATMIFCQSIINLCAVFWHLIILQIHGPITLDWTSWTELNAWLFSVWMLAFSNKDYMSCLNVFSETVFGKHETQS